MQNEFHAIDKKLAVIFNYAFTSLDSCYWIKYDVLFLELFRIFVKKVYGRNSYFTYYRTGCAGQNFGSSLGRIANFTFEEIAYIAENGCDSDTINFPQSFIVYKVTHNQDVDFNLFQVFPYNSFEGIEKYWQKNSDRFNEN